MPNVNEKTYLDEEGLDHVLHLLTEHDTIDVPVLSSASEFTYDGSAKSITFEPYDTEHITITGATSGTNAGNYQAIASLTKQVVMTWEDGSTGPKKFNWKINKANNRLALNTYTCSDVKIQSSLAITAATITAKSTGTITATTTVGTVAVSGNNIILTLPSAGTYNGTITVTDSGDGNYNASTKTITVSNLRIIKLVTWAGGTDAEIVALVQAADDGLVDLYTDAGWRVGDRRTVIVDDWTIKRPYDSKGIISSGPNTSPVTYVLLDRGVDQTYTLSNSVKNKDGSTRTKPSFIIGSLHGDAYAEKDTPTMLQLAEYTETYRNAISETIRPIFKQFKYKASNVTIYNPSVSVTEYEAYVTFAAEKEILGNSASHSTSSEKGTLKQFSYYATTANRKKYGGRDNTYASLGYKNHLTRTLCVYAETTLCKVYITYDGTNSYWSPLENGYNFYAATVCCI